MMRDEAISHVLERLPHHRDAAECYRYSGLGWLALLWRRANGGHGEQCAELLAREQLGVADEQQPLPRCAVSMRVRLAVDDSVCDASRAVAYTTQRVELGAAWRTHISSEDSRSRGSWLGSRRPRSS